jgi:hypothetical protein
VKDESIEANLYKYPGISPLSCIYSNIKVGKDVNTMEELLKVVGNLGFPIAVAAYLLIRIESKLDSLSNSINKLAAILSVKLSYDDIDKAS